MSHNVEGTLRHPQVDSNYNLRSYGRRRLSWVTTPHLPPPSRSRSPAVIDHQSELPAHSFIVSLTRNTTSKTSRQCRKQVDGLVVSGTRANKLLGLATIDIPGFAFPKWQEINTSFVFRKSRSATMGCCVVFVLKHVRNHRQR